MGFFGSLGRALTAPIRATNKVVGKAPGMGAAMGAMNKIPGMQTANKFNPMMQGLPGVGGMGQKPGIGPSPAAAPPPPQQMPQLPAGEGGDTMGGAVGPPSPFQTAAGGLAGMFGGAKPHVMPTQKQPMSKGRFLQQQKKV